MLVRTSRIKLPKDHPEFLQIATSLDRVVQEYNGDSKLLTFYEDFEDYILIPRFYPVQDIVIDKTDEGEDIEINSNVVPRNERQKLLIDEFTHRDNGILRAEPGVGKTVIATCIVSYYKKKTMIVAHKDKLLDQWGLEFLAHTNLKEEDIGRLSGANYEECFSKSIILTTPHVIYTAVTHNKQDFMNALAKANIGILFVDECHVGVGPEKFSKASIFVNAKRVYGLSATPSRGDETQDIIHKHLGEIFYIEPLKDELLKPKIFMLYMPLGVYQRNNYFHWGGKFQLARYNQQMYKASKYNKVIAKIIKQAYEKGRVVLVLGNIIKPLLILAEECNLPKEDVGLFIPGVKDKKYKKYTDQLSDTSNLDEAFHKKKIIFSTYGAARDGNNRVDLDVLIMYTPTTNPEQAVGRILREQSGKKQPVVFDIVDIEGPRVRSGFNGESKEIGWFERSANKRLAIYQKKEWEVNIKREEKI